MPSKDQEGSDKPRQKRTSQAKRLRNANMQAMAAAGATTQKIADEMGITRSQVSRILNSAETKEIIKQGESKITSLIDKSIEKLMEALDSPLDMTNGLKAALSILKSYGLIKESTDINHNFPTPTIIRRLNGDQIILTTTAHVDEGDKK